MATTTSTSAPNRALLVSCAVTAAAVAGILTGCGSSGSSGAGPQPNTHPAAAGSTSPAARSSPQAPVPAESNPPGDIPDTTVYVPFTVPAGHLKLKVPEGWSRKQTTHSYMFTSNLNSISVAWQPMKSAPTVSTVRNAAVPALRNAALAFRLRSIRAVTLHGGGAVEIVYQVNSTPNAVTGRQYRLVIERFEFFRNGRAAVLTLSSAVGSDNVDPWRIVSQSFRWA
jgi:hypothetical protein